MAELLEAAHPQLLHYDRLALNNIIQYYNDYYELISKIVSILDSYVPKEIAGHGGCNLSVSHDVDSRIVSIVYGEIIEEDDGIVPESVEPQSSPEGWIFDDEQCEDVSQDVADDIIEEILESDLIVSADAGKTELEETVDIPNCHGVETDETNGHSCIDYDDGKIGLLLGEDVIVHETEQPTIEESSRGAETTDIKYVCQYVDCSRTFCRAKEYAIHQEKAHPWSVESTIPMRCKYIHCQAKFNNISVLQVHHAKHRMRSVVKKKAPKTEIGPVSLDESHPESRPVTDRPVRVRKCEFCDAVLDSKVNVYSQHCLEKHDRSPYACPLCAAPFHLQSHLSEHVKTEHSPDEVDTFIAQDLWREFSLKQGVWMAECRFCYRVIHSQLSRDNHAEQHRKEVRRFCSLCGGKHNETFCSYPKPKYDAKLAKLHCAQCDRWMSKKSFKDHLATHTKERNYPCTVCKKTFKVRRTASRHIQNHFNASNRKRKCYDCAAVFADETAIPEHYRLEHPTLRPYRCPICGEGFYEKPLLADHCHMHPDEERRMVSVKAPLVSYQIGNARVFECTLCRRAFSTKRATIAHLIVHTDRPFVCPQCKLSFRVDAMLDMHVVDVHQRCVSFPVNEAKDGS